MSSFKSNENIHKKEHVRHVSNCPFKLTKVPDHLMCNLKRSGALTEKPDFVNLTVLSMEIP